MQDIQMQCDAKLICVTVGWIIPFSFDDINSEPRESDEEWENVECTN